jgi:hypothetical protein
MKIELELWHLLTMGFMFVGTLFGFGKLLLARIDKDFGVLADRLMRIEHARTTDLNNWQNLEKDIIRLRGDMNSNFVHREDYIRGQSVLETKIDALANKMETLVLRVLEGGRNAN